MTEQPKETISPLTGIVRVPVRSSNIAEVGHDVHSGTIEVKFLNGAVWQYPGKFDRYTFESLVNAPSVGAFFRKHIYTRVHPQRHIQVTQNEPTAAKKA